MGAFEHQDYPPALLAKRLGIQRDSSRPPLFETMFILQKTQQAEMQALSPFALGIEGARMDADGLALESIDLGGEPAQFDLTLMMVETSKGLAASFQYNSDLFDARTVQRMLEHFRSLLHSIVTDPRKPVSACPLLSASERRQLLADWNQPQTEYPRDLRIHELILEQGKRTPGAIAVQFADQRLTYLELDERVEQVARVLAGLGVTPGTLVGLFLERSIDMLVGLLGVLKAGGAYLPLDPSFPSERLTFMLADSGATVLLTQTSLTSELPPGAAQVICVDALEITAPGGVTLSGALPADEDNKKGYPGTENIKTPSPSSDDLAYIIYTSGSTGVPKGVQIHHRAVVNFLCAMRENLDLDAQDTLLAVTTLSFDIAVLELLLPLSVGARAVIAGSEVAADGALLANALQEFDATIMQATPASWRSLLEAGWTGEKRSQDFMRRRSADR